MGGFDDHLLLGDGLLLRQRVFHLYYFLTFRSPTTKAQITTRTAGMAPTATPTQRLDSALFVEFLQDAMIENFIKPHACFYQVIHFLPD